MKRKIVSIVACLLALTMLAGCGTTASSTSGDTLAVMGTDAPVELDARDVYDKMSEAVAGRLATSFTSTTEMGAEVTTFISMGAEVSAVAEIRLCEKPFAFYSDSSVTASAFGMNIAESFQIYSRKDDNGLTNYFHIDSADKWLRQRLTMVPTDLVGQYAVTGCSGSWEPRDLTMTTTDEGYVLSCMLSAEDVLHAISSPFGEISLEGLDLSVIHLETTYHVDASTFLPTRIEIEFQGLGEVFSDLFNRYANDMMGSFVTDAKAEVKTYREVLSDLRYDEAEVPAVPEAGVSNAADIGTFNILDTVKGI